CDSVQRTLEHPVEAAPAPAATETPVLETQVEGALDRQIIRRVVRAHVGEIRTCYNEGLQDDPALEGRVVVNFTIDESGHVEDSALADSTLTDQAVSACIVSAVSRWTFPKPDHG